MYFVGIDISKYKHDCCIIDATQTIIFRFSFTNDKEGFAELDAHLNSVPDPLDEMRIGFEATSHYALNLKLFLEDTHHGFMEFNPVLLHNFKNSNTLRRTKTDSVDCLEIARFMMTVDYKPYVHGFYHMYCLKSLTRCRFKLVKNRSLYSVSITNVLDAIFPEYKPFFNNTLSTTALYILEHYPSPAKISRMSNASYNKIRSVSMGKFSADKFSKLKLLAKNTVGQSNPYLEAELLSYIDLYKSISAQIDSIENKIREAVLYLNPHMLTIKGLGITTASVILAECGDISKFSNPGKLLAFAGLEPGIYQSGISDKSCKMVKHGSVYLRYAIINCVLPLIKTNVTFSNYYSKKISEGKPHRVAVTHVAKKLIRIIYTLETRDIDYDENLIR